MTTVSGSPPASQQAAVDAALPVLKSMGLSLEDLTATPGQRPAVPTFAEYVPVVSATVTDGTRRAYGSYWNASPGRGRPQRRGAPDRRAALPVPARRGRRADACGRGLPVLAALVSSPPTATLAVHSVVHLASAR
jgi:hypothetical protein